MFRSKEDVKRHVQEIFLKVKNESERHRRCYNIAQQFYKVRDYESAKHYLSLYLSVKEDSPLAHKLQGQIWEALGDKVRALNAYKTSLEYDAKQADVLLTLCGLLCDTDIAMDPDRAQYWCERGSDIFPYDPIIFRLKEKLLKLGGKANNQAFEDLINSELKARPDDVSVRTRLMRLYLETGRSKAAFNHAKELENDEAFHKDLMWYECFAQVCKAYADDFLSQVDWQTYLTWVSVLDKVCSNSMSESAGKKLIDCVQAVFSMDQVLFKAANATVAKEYSELYKQFIKHMSAQLCFHIATLILKRAKKEPSNWKEATGAAAPLLFLALSAPIDTEASWCLALGSNTPKQRLHVHKHTVEKWASDGYYRISQAGFVLLSLAKDTGNQFTDKVTQKISNNWRERTFQRLFTVLDRRSGVATSQFVHSELLAKVVVRLPIHETGYLRTQKLVPVYEKLRESLHHLVWLGLEAVKQNNNKLPPAKHNHKLPVGFHTHGFTWLKLTAHNMSKMSAETLTILDVDAFLYATTLCAIATFEGELVNGYFSSDRPVTLPADITNLLCTQEQINWWEAAHQVNAKQFSTKTNLVVLRQQLQRGLEVVRVDGNHGLEVQLIVKLARTFADRAASVTGKTRDKEEALEKRACLYWEAAIPLLERIERKETVRTSNTRLFEYPKKELSAAEVTSLLEEGRYFVGCQFMKKDQHEKAIEAFKPLRSPYASFNQALIYKQLASLEIEARPREEITSEMRSKHVILLSKARECLNLTSERIRIDRQHPLHRRLPEHIAEVEAALSRIEPDSDMDRNIFGTARSLDLTMQQLGIPFQTNHFNQSDDVNVSEQSLSPLDSPIGGGEPAPRLNGRSHRYSTPRRSFSENKRSGELVDIGQLMQIQTLHDEMKKMQEKLDTIVEYMNELRRDVNKILKPPGADDLYLFGDDEEYPEDVLNSQYPAPFVPSYTAPPQATPTFYPTPTRGVQGTSTVTYGAPPVAQPSVIPLLPALAGYQPPQNLAFYNQHLPDFLQQTIPKPPPPVNVVITTSDTLPTGPPPVQPTLSVTIPPQHRLGGLPVTIPPHNFQIAMPATATTPNLDKSPIVIPDEVDSDDDNEVGYDPCPNFQPIIPLPNEVSVTTGEEDDDVLFENRAKLFRYLDKEWKERGVGVVKILKNRSTNKVRLLMRRDQVHKVCANHLLRSDMELTMLKNSDRALVWVANDFAEEIVQLEKFCIKFKTPEETIKFRDVFNDAKMKYGQSPQKSTKQSEKNVPEKNQGQSILPENKQTESTGKVNLGGFTFTSTPKLKDLKDEQTKLREENKDTHVTPSPFAAFKFTPQKPAANEPSTRPNTGLMQPSLPLFAGLNNTQNKHTLFENMQSDEYSFSEKGYDTNVNQAKVILKQPILPAGQNIPSIDSTTQNSSKTEMGQQLTESSKPQPTNKPQSSSALASANKETPKSILKDPPATTVLSNAAKSSPSTKHVLFQDSPSQQTPTLAALLTSPNTEVLDFAALSKINENKSPAFDSNRKSSGFAGAGSTVFGSIRERKESEGENAEEFVPSAEFKPVIPLPELVEVKTGEESEEVLFKERAKLLRFDSDSKEWKERGIGQMKILKDLRTGITRFLMRREIVHKVCCNHRIIQSIELKASSSSEKAWTWYAVDYSEGEMKNELFAIRFKTAELAKSFKEKVDLVQKQLREDSTSKRSCPDSAEEVSPPSNTWKCQFCHVSNAQESASCKGCSKPNNTDSNSLPKLSDLFRPKAGSWECKACYTVNGSKDSTCVSCDSPKEKLKSTGSPGPAPSPVTAPSLAEMFKPKAGSWECGGCLVRNEADKTVCPACATPKPGHESDAKEAQKSGLPSGSNSFNFGLKPTESTGQTFSFGVNPTATENKGTGFSFGIKPNTEASKTSFVFGANPTETKDKPIVTPATGFTFDQSSSEKTVPPFSFSSKSQVLTSAADSTTKPLEKPSAFNFGNIFGNSSVPGAPTPSNSASDTKNQFAFGENGQFEFGFSGVKAQSPKSPRSPAAGQDSESEPEEDDSYEADHIVFQPVVPLPDKVPVYTGEENEALIYSHRAKLFRFAQGEWKERGVGDIKILRHHTTQKIRLLMRREPIMKICLNHFLTPELIFSLKDEKTWLWSSPDFAENQLTNEQFCIRFKTAEIASEFKAAIDSAKGELEGAEAGSITTASGGETKTTSDDHDFEIVYEAQVSKELREAALKLMLPPNFYSYLDRPGCVGCRGCEPDSEEEKTEAVKSTPIIKPSTVSLTSTTTTVSQPFTFTVKTTSSTADPKLSTTTTAISQPFTFSVPTSSTTSASTIFGSAEHKSSSVTSTVNQPFTFSHNTTSSTASLFGSSEPKVSSVTSAANQPFPFSVKSTAPSLFGSAEPKSFPETSAAPTNLFTFAVKTPSTASPALGSTEPRVSSVTTTSTPLFSSPATVQSGFSFSLNTSTVPATQTATLIFGNTSQTLSSSSSFFGGSPVFQSPASTKAGSVTTETSGTNLLPKTGPLLFGTTPVTQSATTLSYGSSQVKSPLFGGSVFSQTTEESPSFNNTSTPTSQSPDTASVFGTPTSTVNNSLNTSSFFGNLTTFQSPTTASVFGGSSPQANTTPFGTPSSQTVGTANGDTSFLFKYNATFGDIAASQSAKQPAHESDKTGNFTWSGAGSTVFGGKKAVGEEEGGGESGGEEGDADTSHDPVFEPIIPLPDAVEVRTGEEEEDILFSQRAKLYRYDTDGKEWKERGVGNMKILKHQHTNSYRLLLRREQVHKVVCNQLIVGELELQSLANSDRAFCWAGMNMTEEYSEPRLEKVAVRFKNCDQAIEFKSRLEECIAIVKARKENVISEILDSSAELLEPSVTIEEVVTDYSEEGEVEETDYGEDDEGLFEKRATLHVRNSKSGWTKISQGDLSINYHDGNSAIIFFQQDNSDQIAIAVQCDGNIQNMSGKEVVFNGQRYDGDSQLEQFKAEFSTPQATEEFLEVMNELMELSNVTPSFEETEQED